MTWEIFCGIVTLCGFGITVGTLVARLAAVIARLNASVTEFSAAIASLKKENAGDHRAMQETLNGHERRITILEEHDERH
ncbi:MAG: hypothetical protein IJZ08_00055 [Clostridia bacterium]|nr:hypothetical protein [Clostridia bacterium]